MLRDTPFTHFSTFLPHVYIKISLYPLPLHSTGMSRVSHLGSLTVRGVSLCFCHFPMWCLGPGHSGVALDGSIPDLCLLLYFYGMLKWVCAFEPSSSYIFSYS